MSARHRELTPSDRARLETIRRALGVIEKSLGVTARRMEGEIASDLQRAAAHVDAAVGRIACAMDDP